MHGEGLYKGKKNGVARKSEWYDGKEVKRGILDWFSV